MKQYQELLRHILDKGTRHEDRTGVGTISVFGYQMRFDLRENFPIVTTKRVPFRWIFEELAWFLSGDTSEKNLRARGVDIWVEWATAEQTARFGREEGDLGPVYGYLWRSFGGDYPQMNGVDQIARLIREIETNPNSRRLIVTGWNPATCDEVALPPCHTLFQFKIENEKTLHCQLYQRSADAFLGVPFNISSYALLTALNRARLRFAGRRIRPHFWRFARLPESSGTGRRAFAARAFAFAKIGISERRKFKRLGRLIEFQI